MFIPKSIQKLINNFDENSDKSYDKAWLDWTIFSKRRPVDLISLIIGEDNVASAIKRRAIFVLLSPKKKWCPLNWWIDEKNKYNEDDPYLMRFKNSFIKDIDNELLHYIIKVLNVFMKALAKNSNDEFHKRNAFSAYYELIFELLEKYSEKTEKEGIESLFNYIRYGINGSGNILIRFFDKEEINEKQKARMQKKLETFIKKSKDSKMKEKLSRYYKTSILYLLEIDHDFYNLDKLSEAIKFLVEFQTDSIKAWEFLRLIEALTEEEASDFYKKASEKFLGLNKEVLSTLEKKNLEALQKLAEKLLARNPFKEEKNILQKHSSLIEKYLKKRKDEKKKQEEERQAKISAHDEELEKKHNKLDKEKNRVYSALR